MSRYLEFTALVVCCASLTFAHAMKSNPISVSGSDDNPPEILTANLGIVDIPFPQVLANVTGCEQEVGDEGMPMVLSVQVDADTLDAEDFVLTTESGAITMPTCATLAPADDDDELRTILLAGPLGSAEDLPVSVTIVGELFSVDGDELTGLSAEVTLDPNGPALVLAILQPQENTPKGRWFSSLQRIQTTWQGGVTGPFNRELGFRELLGFRIIDEDGKAHIPWGFEDLNDGDNHVELLVPNGVVPVQVTVAPGTVFNPTNQPNSETTAEVTDSSQ